ncbi:MAG: hypothetical protein ACR2NU_15880 [Aeoliella sp.]
MANKFLKLMLMLALVAAGRAAYALDLKGIQLNPGERLVAIEGVPVPGPGQVASAVQPQANSAASGAANIVGNLTRSNLPFSHTPGASALEKANAERARNCQRPLIPDPQLQALALRKATIAAQRRFKNHIGGSLGGAKCEGVGHTHGRFLSCCLDEPGTYGGAAMVQGADGWYCCLLVR